MSAEIVLHLGAHRTGSTTLQGILDANAEMLAATGVRVLTPPRPGKRGVATVRDVVRQVKRTSRLPVARLRRWANRRAGAALRETLAGAKGRVVISDEMLLGRAYGRDGTALYPDLAELLGGFREALDRPVGEVSITLRAYDGFLVSVYAMRAVYAGPQPEFEALRARLLAVERGWPVVLEEIAARFPEARLQVSTVEETPLERRLGQLVGPAAAARLRYDADARSNLAPSLPAITAARTRRLRHAEADALIAAHAGGARFDPLTDAERDRLRARYAADLATLRTHPRWRLDDAD